MSKNKKIKITQIKSVIGYRIQARGTLDALGLKKMNQSVIHNDTPAIRGMVNSIQHLVKMEEL